MYTHGLKFGMFGFGYFRSQSRVHHQKCQKQPYSIIFSRITKRVSCKRARLDIMGFMIYTFCHFGSLEPFLRGFCGLVSNFSFQNRSKSLSRLLKVLETFLWAQNDRNMRVYISTYNILKL